MVICSLHFTPDSFSGLGNRKNLLWNAVPTLFAVPHLNAKVNQITHRLIILNTTNTQCTFLLCLIVIFLPPAKQFQEEAEEGFKICC